MRGSVVYPKPKEQGGKLIRQVIADLRSVLDLPIASHILIAASAGSDSTALGHLISHYGRRIAPKSDISLVHINHGWRGRASADDARWVETQARRWGIGFIGHELSGPPKNCGDSWEDLARRARTAIFEREAKQRGAVVLTAHHADDLAETLLWRLLTGNASCQGAGIAMRHGCLIRPFLSIRKSELKLYLKEEGEGWREDSTNHESRFLRARMRAELMPVVERLFPKAVERLVERARELQHESQVGKETASIGPEILFSAAGLKARRAHWQALKSILGRSEGTRWCGELHLPGGWRLRSPGTQPEKWILERLPDVEG